MDDSGTISLLVGVIVAAVVTIQQMFATYNIIFDDIPTKLERKVGKKRKCEVTPYKRNHSMKYSSPATPLEPINVLHKILQDSDRAYMHKVTHLHEWQFFLLADRLKDLILRPRLRDDGTRPKHDHFHRLFFCLRWLNDGNFHRSREAEAGWGKSSLQEDLVHVLIAIVEGLDDQIQWPDENHRRELANVFPGIFHGCIGVGDVKEYQIEKPKDRIKEKRSWSGKKK
jgi:hypothetical protein